MNRLDTNMNNDTLAMIRTFNRACRHLSFVIDGIFAEFEHKATGLYVIDSYFESDYSIIKTLPKPDVNVSIDLNDNNGNQIEVIIRCDFYCVNDFNWNVKVFNSAKQICDEVAYSALDVIDIIEKYVNGDCDVETK